MTELAYKQLTADQERAAVLQRLSTAESEHFRLNLDKLVREAEGQETDSLKDQIAGQEKAVKALQKELAKYPEPEAPVAPGP